MFSVIIPLYNKRQFISRSIDSVLNQYFSDFEIIVVDDGSTDGGGEFVAAQYGSKVKLIYQDNQGVSVARNKGIQNAEFEYIAFLDADDMWHPYFLYWMHHVMEKFPEVKMLGSSYSNVALPEKFENPIISEIEDYFAQADYNTLFTSSSTVIHQGFFQYREGFKTHLTKGEDIDVWLRAFDWFKKAYYVRAPLVFYDLKASESLKCNPNLHQTIFCEIYNEDFIISDYFPSWQTFRDKYLMLNLFQYFDRKVNYPIAKKLLRQRNNPYTLSQLPYLLPFSFSRYILRNRRLKKLVLNYLKFCFRYIYK
ncbi:glycosyltransferase family 2 protein [Cyclobacterium jeungdonense]|uniref:Glycosyltransferase family 2 protein n=1 Tax=Cyclobacterium jeungdonense TaxID=708087 RepID=A0ABT8CEG4_9BACT|nr:glycosyltransferase family 2 protein [Cyclobacterium jeungdonense]MDN3690577.1 glycosyltransferase family 2 protein [Cyclobacterium jeungdonense]